MARQKQDPELQPDIERPRFGFGEEHEENQEGEKGSEERKEEEIADELSAVLTGSAEEGEKDKPKEEKKKQPRKEDPERVQEPEARSRAEERMRQEERLKRQLETKQLERERYEQAKRGLLRKLGEFRTRLKREQLLGKKLSPEQSEEQKREITRFVDEFKISEHGMVLERLLPDKPGASTFREKLLRIVEMSLDLPYWSKGDFAHRYQRRFGSNVDEEFDEEQQEILRDLLEAELEEEEAIGK